LSEVSKVKNNNNKSRFTLDMTPELRTRLKIAAARKGITMRQYSLSAIEQQLEREEVGVLASGSFDHGAVEMAKALQRAVFGKQRLTDDSIELIRQAREGRASEL
jgi:predicted DNA-binding protein